MFPVSAGLTASIVGQTKAGSVFSRRSCNLARISRERGDAALANPREFRTMTKPVSRFAPAALALASQAALVAAALAALPAPALADEAKAGKVVHCYGINTCKGTSDCATARNSCKGQNTCKGQGFKAESKDKCMADGGSLTETK
jgi:uncharacterized membrane protein